MENDLMPMINLAQSEGYRVAIYPQDSSGMEYVLLDKYGQTFGSYGSSIFEALEKALVKAGLM